MRQCMSEKNVARIRARTGLDIDRILVRGGTDHRKDLRLTDGRWVSLWPDGTLEGANDEELQRYRVLYARSRGGEA